MLPRTNITEPLQTLPSSRGALVRAFLLADPATPIAELYPPTAQYAGFNLLTLAAARAADGTLHFPHATRVSNGGARGPIALRALRQDERAAGALSNGIDAAGDAWPKVLIGRALFVSAVSADADDDDDEAALAARLFALLRTPPAEPVRAREELRRAVCVPPLVVGAGHYATRLATVLLIRRSGAARFVERDVWVDAPGGAGEPLLNSPEGAGDRIWEGRVEAPDVQIKV